MSDLNLFAVGRIAGCFGIKGYVKVQPSTHSLERLKELGEVYLGKTSGDAVRDIVEDVIFSNRGVLMKFASIHDRTAAEKISGQFLFVEEKELAPPSKGSYFIHDIIGCGVWTQEGRFIGTVEDVYRLPGQDLWAVRGGGKVLMIPAVREFVSSVDIKSRRIVIKVIEGLIEQ